jgi:phosphatidylserine/phosphatidylglycerophosphate/cardiolipin synthase-like enzyme
MRRLRIVGIAITLATTSCGTMTSSPHAPDGAGTAPLLLPAPATAVGADTVTVLRSGEATFTEIRRLIDAATSSIEAEVYEFGRSDLIEAVLRAQTRGLAVRVIADPSERASAATAVQLRAAGVDVADYPVRSRMIDHVKLLVVDGTTAVVGGINWGQRSAGNHDFDVEVRGPVVTNLSRVFRRDLVTCGRNAVVPAAVPDPFIVVAATLPGGDILPMVLGLVSSAKTTLDVAMFTLTHAGVVAALEDAQARGVAVRVLLDPSERPSDAAAASLRAHGLPVRLYRSHGEKLHAKMGVADRSSVVVGSANWTVSGFEHNHELDVSIPGDTAVATAFEQQFESDWSASA